MKSEEDSWPDSVFSWENLGQRRIGVSVMVGGGDIFEQWKLVSSTASVLVLRRGEAERGARMWGPR